MEEIHEDVDIDLGDSNKKPVVVNAAGGSHVTVNVNVRNYQYPEWLEEEVQKRFKWDGDDSSWQK